MASTELEAGRSAWRPTQPDLDLVGLAGGGRSEPISGRRRSLQIAFSAALHSLVVGALLVIPLLRDVPLPEPTQAVRAFFVTPALVPPPPPPPPPAPASRATARVAPIASLNSPSAFVAPTQIPNAIDLPEEADLGLPGGVAGGVEGGVAGGVVGGLVGGLGQAVPATAPLRVGGAIREPRKIFNVNPTYPTVARAARIQGVVVIECVIGTDGRVRDAKVVDSQPLLDNAALAAVQQWRYTPTLYQGVPVPVILTVTVTFRLA
jgi:protein TonB